MKFKLKRIDWYIIKKFLGTYFFAITLILAISVVFDINEKIDYFLKPEVPLKAIVFDYYVNFIPYFGNMFSPLFTFIAVIFFTSKLADNSEVIAMLACGMSFRRLMLPYAISAAVIALGTFVLNSYVIPPANKTRIDFQNKYIKNKKVSYIRSAQLEIEPGVFAYFNRYDDRSSMGYQFSLDHFEGKKLVSRLTAKSIKHDSLYNWTVIDYMIRDFDGMREHITQGSRKDTTLTIVPSDFLISVNDCETLTTPELATYIERQFRGHPDRLYPHLHRSVALVAQDKRRHGIKHRYRTGIELLLHSLYDRHFDLRHQRQPQSRPCRLDSEYSLYFHCDLFVPKGTEVKSVDLSNINPFPFDSFTEQSIHAVTQTDNIHFAA